MPEAPLVPERCEPESPAFARTVVTAAVLRLGEKVLLARRKPGDHLAGRWEFPGGKVETGESPAEAMERELHEELSIKAEAGAVLCTVDYDYPHLALHLVVFEIDRFTGTPVAADHDELAWVAVSGIAAYDLAPADRLVLPYL